MKKNSVKGYAILGILFVLISVIVFAAPIIKTAAFWISYTFTVIAFAAQIMIWKVAIGHRKSLKSKFLGFPVVYIGFVYLAIQIVSLAVFLLFPTLPFWSAVITCIVIVGISSTCMIASDVGRDEIERVSAKVQEKTFYMKDLQSAVELLSNEESDTATKSALIQLSEKIRYSDPMGDEHVADIEEQITAKIASLRFSEDKAKDINELNSLLDERNKKIKILK